jgi:adenine deaminase
MMDELSRIHNVRRIAEPSDPMHDLIIRGGEAVDGSGGARRSADIAVDGDRISAVGRVDDATSSTQTAVWSRLAGSMSTPTTTVRPPPAIRYSRPRVGMASRAS